MTTDSLINVVTTAVDTVKTVLQPIVNNHYHEDSESNIEMVGLIMPFIFVLTFMGIFFYYKNNKDKRIAAERMKMIENGIPFPQDVTKNSSDKVPYGKTVPLFFAKLFFGFGAGLLLGTMISKMFNLDSTFTIFGMIFLSIGFVVIFGDVMIAKFSKKETETHQENNPKNE